MLLGPFDPACGVAGGRTGQRTSECVRRIAGTTATENLVLGNFIGTDVTGTDRARQVVGDDEAAAAMGGFGGGMDLGGLLG